MRLTKSLSNSDSFIDAPISYEGSKYSPMSHRAIIETMSQYLEKRDIKVQEESYLVGGFGQKVIGQLDLGVLDKDLNYTLAWKNSLDGSMSFGIASGSLVQVCSNTNIWGEDVNIKRRHTGRNTTQDIIEHINGALNTFENVYSLHTRRKEQLSNEKVSKRQISELIGRLYLEDDLIKDQQLSIIKKELNSPSFEYGAPDSAWELYNHCTYAIKESHPLNWHKTHKDVCTFFEENFLWE